MMHSTVEMIRFLDQRQQHLNDDPTASESGGPAVDVTPSVEERRFQPTAAVALDNVTDRRSTSTTSSVDTREGATVREMLRSSSEYPDRRIASGGDAIAVIAVADTDADPAAAAAAAAAVATVTTADNARRTTAFARRRFYPLQERLIVLASFCLLLTVDAFIVFLINLCGLCTFWLCVLLDTLLVVNLFLLLASISSF